MQCLIGYARSEGIGRLEGTILRENTRMIGLCSALGFALRGDEAEKTLVRATLTL
jgi:acetyltransferase